LPHSVYSALISSSYTVLKRGLYYSQIKESLSRFTWHVNIAFLVFAGTTSFLTLSSLNTQITSLLSLLYRRHLAIFRRVCWLPETTQTHVALDYTFRPHIGRENTVKMTSQVAMSHVCATTRSWHWTHHWQSVEHCQWPWCLEGATTHHRSSSPVSDRVVCVLSFVRADVQLKVFIGPTETNAVTLNFDPVTLTYDLWPWTFVACRLCHDQTLCEIWAQSGNPRRSYCSLIFDLVTLLNMYHVLRYALRESCYEFMKCNDFLMLIRPITL